jgi:hypothetical protein
VRVLAFLEWNAVVIGIIAVIAGEYFALPRGFHLGVFLIGAGILLGGLESVYTRDPSFRLTDSGYDTYHGTPALIVGLMMLLVGTAVIASAYLLTEGSWHSTVNYLMRRPGPVLAAAGLLLTGTGVLLMLNPSGRSGAGWTLLVRFPKAVAGIVLLAAGLAGVGLGAWEWFEPRAFDHFAKSVSEHPDLQSLARWWRGFTGLRR